MNRRDFLATTVTTAAATADDKPVREYYELRQYRMRRGRMTDGIHPYLRTALVPALNRAGIQPVGVFDVLFGDSPTTYVLMPHSSIESTVTRLDDAEYRKAGAAFLEAPASDPAYERMESSLLLAFEKMPKVQPPDTTKPRIFELRRYESQSERASKKKIEMFNDAGEMAIFRRIGFRPVFFGEMLIGPRRPNLTYMLCFDSLEAREKLWNVFRNDPEWKKLSAMPEYKDSEVVSGISSIVLNPAPYSQV